MLEPQPFGVFVIAGEYRFTDWFSMVLQVDDNTVPYRHSPFSLLREQATEIGGGFRFKVWEQEGWKSASWTDSKRPGSPASFDAKWLF